MEIALILVVAFIALRSGLLGNLGMDGPVGKYSRSAPSDLYDPRAKRNPDGTQIIGELAGAGACIGGAAAAGAPQLGVALAPVCSQLGAKAAPFVVSTVKDEIKEAGGAFAQLKKLGGMDIVKGQAKQKVLELIAYSNPITAVPVGIINAKNNVKTGISVAKKVGGGVKNLVSHIF
jgi:hypothetical protein